LQTLCWLSRVIDRWREFNPVGKKQGEGRIRGRRRASAFIAYRRTWLTVIASDLEGIVSISKKLLKLGASYAFVINEMITAVSTCTSSALSDVPEERRNL
jgi:hypothetical protein